jgi:hypothetical protein
MMKCILGAPALVFSLTFFSMNAGLSADTAASSGEVAAPGNQAGQQTPAGALAAEVREIANYRMMSHAKKEKRIANAVRIAVVGATAYKDPAEVVNIASELAAAAASAAPPFKDAIVHAVLFSPSVASIDGASGQIQAAVDYAAAQAMKAEKAADVAAAKNPAKPVMIEKTAEVKPVENPATPETAEKAPVPAAVENAPQVAAVETAAAPQNQAPPAPPENATVVQPAEAVAEPAETAATIRDRENGTKASTAENGAVQDRSTPWTLPKIDLGKNASLHFTADLSARYDDNVFLINKNKVGDEILSATPGAVFQFGQSSLANGSLSYQESFQDYIHKTSSAQQLGAGAGNFGYSNERLDLTANAGYVQSAQNQEGFFIPGQNVVVRRDQLDLGSSQEVHFTEKTSAGMGESYSHTHYRTPGLGLVDNHSSSFPVNLYYAVRPKVDLSAGFTQSEIKTPGNGPGSTQVNRYYNIGARGDFTPKLTGSFSVGYTTSNVTQSKNTSLFSFSGNFGYALRPKTSLTLAASRSFGAGAQGEQTKTTSAALSASTVFSPRWQGSAGLTYQNLGYPANRTDNNIAGTVSATYVFSTKINATLSYSLNNNYSNVSTAEYLDNILSLSVGLKY